jgi:Fe-S-cluster containining protein
VHSHRAECCHFLKTGKTPLVTRGELLVLIKAMRAAGKKMPPATTDGACPFLDRQRLRCTVYEGRPFGCRTHFCAPAGGPLARRDVWDLIRRLEAADCSINGSGGVSLTSALRPAALAWREAC